MWEKTADSVCMDTESPSFYPDRLSCVYLFSVSVAVPSASSAARANVSLRVG